MGRIVSFVTISNPLDPEKSLTFDALVDTGASHMTLPSAWKSKLGETATFQDLVVELANQETTRGEICGTVKVQVEGFRPVFTEVRFIDMEPVKGKFEPLIGYLVLEAIPAAVDMLGHRLVQVNRLDAKPMKIIQGCIRSPRGSENSTEVFDA